MRIRCSVCNVKLVEVSPLADIETNLCLSVCERCCQDCVSCAINEKRRVKTAAVAGYY